MLSQKSGSILFVCVDIVSNGKLFFEEFDLLGGKTCFCAELIAFTNNKVD